MEEKYEFQNEFEEDEKEAKKVTERVCKWWRRNKYVIQDTVLAASIGLATGFTTYFMGHVAGFGDGYKFARNEMFEVMEHLPAPNTPKN